MFTHVPGIGPPNARIAIVGEAPGADEERMGQPFVGSSGKLLNQMLAAVGIDRNQCYITNVVKMRPPKNDFGVYYQDQRRDNPTPLLASAIEDLRAELQRVKPNITIALGGEALRALTGKRSIEHWRGSLLTGFPGKVVATYHPAYILRVYDSRPICELDLRRAAAESETPQLNLPETRFQLQPSFRDVCTYLELALGAKRVAFDIETSGPIVRCLGLSTEVGRAICIPFISSSYEVRPGQTTLLLADTTGPLSQSHWSEEEEYEILRRLDLLFRSDVPKVAQNFPFDSVTLAGEFGLHCANLHMDTMVAHHACYCEMPKGLDFLCSIYTRLPYYSDYDCSVDQETWLYNCYDAAVTLEISYRLDTELREHGLEEFYHNHLQPTLLALTRAENRGCCVDTTLQGEIRERTVRELAVISETLSKLTQGKLQNPGSSKQKSEYLYGHLHLPVQLHYKTKRPTTDKNAMTALEKKHPEHGELFRLCMEYEKKSTLLSLLKKELPDGRIYTHYNLAGTVTGRLTSSEPLFREGTNLQNIERGATRRLFRSDTDDHVLLKCDLSQAEFRIVAWLARIERIINLYQTDLRFDVHTWNAATNIFQIPLAQVTKDQRKVAKDGVYGGNYGMHYKRAAVVYRMPIETARFILDRYRKAVPEVPQWWDTVQQTINSTRTVLSPLGRKRMFFGRLDDETYRAAYSHSAQNIVSDIINRAFALADEVLPEQYCFPLLQVHDEIVFHCRKEYVPCATKIIRNIMEYPIQIWPDLPPLIIPVDIEVGQNWFDVKPYKEQEWISETTKLHAVLQQSIPTTLASLA